MATFRAGGDHDAAIEFIVESGVRFPAHLVALVGYVRDATAGDTRRTLATMGQQPDIRLE